MKEEFYTLKGYKIKNEEILSSSMEDYIEMICRLSEKSDEVRVSELSSALNVQPPSTTKMIRRLAKENYVTYERYGFIKLTEKGREVGSKLLERHRIIFEFLECIGVKENILEQTEIIEHAVNDEVLNKIDELTQFLKKCDKYK
ncbi:MAG TPA: iron dependent repressor, metal binding and dimerization domain protein [Sedimentibacter sp.]|jgi:DtxR family Mn-dependent transcriptional regulator|nr:iron dependent repressor, metal binding and dimerization domain protein [Sedimentibacter sp.]HOG62345.1 iron dependent repressor, metal binding and dimerization domain protein [Sedimentibacter sp.]HOT21655.1 iron dependent repressor, metal binding and dimerization domain protein [Sedimentibacter sp.]HPB79368.1 iron dependent repressor, metal binding and dimerization domain protein [Sedimentibacter sp.]HPV84951.1 iron dependent repressor, metal binding and dimerization domain protein [Sedimen